MVSLTLGPGSPGSAGVPGGKAGDAAQGGVCVCARLRAHSFLPSQCCLEDGGFFLGAAPCPHSHHRGLWSSRPALLRATPVLAILNLGLLFARLHPPVACLDLVELGPASSLLGAPF